MSASVWLGLVLIAALSPLSGVRPASQQSADGAAGSRLYLTHCATCHGKAGRGDGPMAPYLRVTPTNLAAISTRHEGVFPTASMGARRSPCTDRRCRSGAMHSRLPATPRRTSSPRQRSAPSWLISARSRIAPASEVVCLPPRWRSPARAVTSADASATGLCRWALEHHRQTRTYPTAPPLPARRETSLWPSTADRDPSTVSRLQ